MYLSIKQLAKKLNKTDTQIRAWINRGLIKTAYISREGVGSKTIRILWEEDIDLLTVKEAAKILGVTTATISNWIRNGTLNAIVPNRLHKTKCLRLIKRKDLMTLVGNGKTAEENS